MIALYRIAPIVSLALLGAVATTTAVAQQPIDLRPVPDNRPELDKRLESMGKFSEQEAAAADRRRHQELNRRLDSERGISQKSGPTIGTTPDNKGPAGGYKWSTK